MLQYWCLTGEVVAALKSQLTLVWKSREPWEPCATLKIFKIQVTFVGKRALRAGGGGGLKFQSVVMSTNSFSCFSDPVRGSLEICTAFQTFIHSILVTEKIKSNVFIVFFEAFRGLSSKPKAQFFSFQFMCILPWLLAVAFSSGEELKCRRDIINQLDANTLAAMLSHSWRIFKKFFFHCNKPLLVDIKHAWCIIIALNCINSKWTFWRLFWRGKAIFLLFPPASCWSTAEWNSDSSICVGREIISRDKTRKKEKWTRKNREEQQHLQQQPFSPEFNWTIILEKEFVATIAKCDKFLPTMNYKFWIWENINK